MQVEDCLDGTNSRKKKSTRSRKGCFTCRYKKKKCDEMKPHCMGCIKSGFECVWPDSKNNSLSHSTKFIPKKRHDSGKRFQFVAVSSNIPKRKKRRLSNKLKGKELTFNKGDLVKWDDNNNTPPNFEESRTDKRESHSRSNLSDDYFDGFKLKAPSGYIYLDEISMGNDISVEEIKHCESNRTALYDKPKYDTDDMANSLSPITQSLSLSTSLSGYNTWIPGVEMSTRDAHFFHVFVNGFITAISPQHTCPELSPGAIFIPQGANSPILQEIFYVCGASFLSWEVPDLRDSVQRRYLACLNHLASKINTPDVDVTEDWMLAAMLLLCLRDKYFGSVSSKPAAHITMAFQIIKKRRIKRLNSSKKIKEIEYDDVYNQIDEKEEKHNSLDMITIKNPNDNQIVDFINKKDDILEWLINADDQGSSGDFTPNEKVLIESFLYNYSVLLLICDRNLIGFLPSPFEIFEEYKYVLCTNLYNCPVPWMNNPVFGAALDAFEFAAKASWLCFKSPLDEFNMQLAGNLYDRTMLYVPPELSEEVMSKESKDIYIQLKESTIVADIVAKAVSILMIRILDSNALPSDENIQELVSQIYNKFQLLTTLSSLWTICGWPIVVTGVVSMSPLHREYFKSQCGRLSELFHASYFTQIIEILDKAWGDFEGTTPSWDILFDRSSLQAFCI